ncbi:MAG TPA: carboxypeptidase regulatory-like domain-containing protein [Terriglobales bacterium]|nr:carboxypeptidase regulatory-like domain-containing protein [Terriglobales bacterium]
MAGIKQNRDFAFFSHIMKHLVPGLSFAILMLVSVCSWAGVGGTVSGTVKDSTGAVVPNATVNAINIDTGVHATLTTNGSGFYSFPQLNVGRYSIAIEKNGFKPYQRTGITIDANSALTVDAVLNVGETSDAITVVENQTQVETMSTQIGEVITAARMTAVPLNGRSFTDLLSLQPGVAPVTSITSDTVQDVGASVLSPSGDLNPGTVSINGQREFANNFIVNGSDVEEDVNMGAAIIPNLDSIAEFRILTDSFDAEYGEFSGGQINVITKSGTNAFHGDVFEFLRNTNFDARNYFSPARGAFNQNQFGGTFGGPIRKTKLFFFGDYQGTRSTQGVDTGEIPVPSAQDRAGNFSDSPNLFSTSNDANGNPIASTVQSSCTNNQCFAAVLQNSLGYSVNSAEPFYFTSSTINPATINPTTGVGTPFGYNCTNNTQCVFPNTMGGVGAIIPQVAFSAPGRNLLQYIPQPTVGTNLFATSAYNQTLRDDKGAYRVDANTRWGLLSGYYFLDDWSQNNPYPVAQGGANVPGFNALYTGRAQLLGLGLTKTVSATAVNEFRFSYLRDGNDLGKPVGGVGVSLESQGFQVGQGTPGIVALSPSTEGVESIGFNAFTMGTNTNELKQIGNTFQWLDNFSKVIGTHTIKVGGEFHYDQVNVDAIAQFNGSFLFFGSKTGSDFADFLLGAPSQYNQSQLQPFYGRNKYVGIYGQDSWRLAHSLTLNYGLRWDRIEPWYEKYNQIATFDPGKQSVVFPNAPPGILYPTDPGVSRTLAPPGNRDFAPRIGLAYSPSASGDGLFAKIFGGPGNTSIRASYGVFYTAIEALTIGVMSANAPYGTTYTSPAPPLFATPFVSASNGQDLGQYFPVTLAPLNSSASHPDPIDFAQFEPITGLPNYSMNNRVPYTEEYMLSLERGFGAHTVLSVNYIGNQGHRLLVLEEANPGDPALCLALSNPANLALNQTPCGPFGEDSTYITSPTSPFGGQTFQGTRGPLGSNFGSNAYQTTIGNSNYNALQVTFRHSSKRFNILAGYTYSKSQDQSSNLGEAVNPLDPSLSKALSSFDVKHNFVVSYSYQIPFESLLHASNRWTEGWELSGITHFSSGLPVTLINYGDNSLLGSEPNGINNFGVDEPDYNGGPLHLNHNPRNGPYFYSSQFSENALGTPGTARRRFFPGPGLSNFDMALLKNVRLNESKSLQFRLEGFNVFNHAQFFGPQSVDGNIADLGSTFGQVVSAQPARILQLGAKFVF